MPSRALLLSALLCAACHGARPVPLVPAWARSPPSRPPLSLDVTRPTTPPDPDSKDQTLAAVNYFSSERTPAALVAGATLGAMFAFPLAQTDTPALGLAKRLYVLLINTAFCNSLMAVFVCSLAVARLLGDLGDGYGRTARAVMLRELPVHLLASQAHFLSSVLAFTAALALRMYASYNNGCPIFARAMVLFIGATVSLMLFVFNTTLEDHRSFGHLWAAYLKELWRHARASTPRLRPPPPMAVLSVALLAAGAVDTGVILGAIARRMCPLTGGLGA